MKRTVDMKCSRLKWIRGKLPEHKLKPVGLGDACMHNLHDGTRRIILTGLTFTIELQVNSRGWTHSLSSIGSHNNKQSATWKARLTTNYNLLNWCGILRHSSVRITENIKIDFERKARTREIIAQNQPNAGKARKSNQQPCLQIVLVTTVRSLSASTN